jgi:IS1 family transposase
MKSFLELVQEAKSDEVHHVMTFGRMNPPTTGHLKLIDKVKEIAKKHHRTKAETALIEAKNSIVRQGVFDLTNDKKIKLLNYNFQHTLNLKFLTILIISLTIIYLINKKKMMMLILFHTHPHIS